MDKREYIRSLNRKSYEVIAHEFDATRQKPWPELFEFGSLVKPGFFVADLGCGNGRLLKALPSVNFNYLGIDSNAYLLKKAQEAFPERSFILHELETISLQPGRFDVIFCIATLHHLAVKGDRANLLRESYNALKPGGVLVCTVWFLWQLRYLTYIVQNTSKKIAWNDFFIPWKAGGNTVWRYCHGFTKGELQRLLAQAGFSTVTVTTLRSGVGRGYNYVVRAVK